MQIVLYVLLTYTVVAFLLILGAIGRDFIRGFCRAADTRLYDSLLDTKRPSLSTQVCLKFGQREGWFSAKPLSMGSFYEYGMRLRVALLVLRGKAFTVQYAEDFIETHKDDLRCN